MQTSTESTHPQPPQAALIEFKKVYKSFGTNRVLEGIDFCVQPGESLVILGRSGSGKSVAVKCLVGLTPIDRGEISLMGQNISQLNENQLNSLRLKIGFLFQNGALYDSMTVRENLAFTLKHNQQRLTEAQVQAAIAESLKNVGLEEAIDKMPSELSGGMRKRIGLARALIIQPELIIYDEPTAGLDTITAREIIELMRRIKQKYHATSIIITHDLICAKYTGDRIIVLKDGGIKAQGTFQDIEQNADGWVQSFFLK